MNLRQLRQVVELGAQLPTQLRKPVHIESAARNIRDRLETRDELFVATARRMIFNQPASPYGRLLRWAGCEWSDFSHAVVTDGLDATLEKLREAGVYMTLEEFKRQVPVQRPGLTFEPAEADFDNPLLERGGITGTTSGSTGPALRVMYNWEFIEEEAEHELVLYEHHGVFNAPLALWYPAPPGVAGLHNALMTLKTGRAPARWFSQTDPRGSNIPVLHRWTLRGVRLSARLAGLTVPVQEFADLTRVDIVLDWMLAALRDRSHCVLRTFASSAVRLAERARERGVELNGAVIFSGGEPLTDLRREFLESSGARVYPRYVATEAGLLAAACRNRTATDEMHVYTDRIALIDHSGELLVTSLLPATGKVLFNTALGDIGELSRRACDCELGRLGFDQHVSNVRSQQRLTAEGMTVRVSDLDAVVADVLSVHGGSPDAFQLRPSTDHRGLSRIEIAINPAVGPIDENELLAGIYLAMRRQGGGIAIAADVWARGGTMRLVREIHASGPKRSAARAGS